MAAEVMARGRTNVDRSHLIELYLKSRTLKSASTKVDTQCYRLVKVETPLTPSVEYEGLFDDVNKPAAPSRPGSPQPEAAIELEPDLPPESFTVDQKPKHHLAGHVDVQLKRRRKLPEIPRNRKPLQGLSLADEFRVVDSNLLVTPFSSQLYLEVDTSGREPRSTFRYLSDSMTEESPNAETDALSKGCEAQKVRSVFENSRPCLKSLVNAEPERDSGHSSSSLSSPCSALWGPLLRLRAADATHRGIHRFVPRHPDELAVDLGDPVYVIRECSIEDSWCEGVNLTTGRRGVFPNAYVTDVDYTEFSQERRSVLRRERFLLYFLGSVEVSSHRGTDTLCQVDDCHLKTMAAT